ncbi:MAG: hypothetical protein HYR63_00500 [Proteobacteria bacterium]|nr:hypothetical protein [Pseudomonadota bacterium]
MSISALHSTGGAQSQSRPAPSRVEPAPPNDNPETAHGPSRLDDSAAAQRRQADAADAQRHADAAAAARQKADAAAEQKSQAPQRGGNVNVTA